MEKIWSLNVQSILRKQWNMKKGNAENSSHTWYSNEGMAKEWQYFTSTEYYYYMAIQIIIKTIATHKNS